LDKCGYAKLIDFGLAKSLVDSNDFTTTYCGTAEYLCKNKQPIRIIN